MATIAALSEDFETGTNGTAITTANTFFTDTAPVVPMVITSADAISGSRAATLGTLNSASVNTVSFTGATDGWVMFYFKPMTLPTVNTGFLSAYEGDTTKLWDLRFLTGGQLQYRSVNTARWQSNVLALNAWHRIAINSNPDSGGAGSTTIRVYSGAQLHSASPTQNSTEQLLAATATICDNYRFGALNADATFQFLMDYVRGDSDTEPASLTGGVPVNWFQGREVRIG